MIKCTCAKCQNVSEVFENQVGQTVTCHNCGNINLVPATSQATATAEPQADSQSQQQTPPPGQASGAQQTPPDVPPDQAALDKQKDERMWGMFCHVAALSWFVGIPFGWVIGPLIVWLIKKNDSPFIDQQGKNAINFQISMTIYYTIAGLLCLIVVGFLLLPALAIFGFIVVLIAAIKASDGETYQYPLSFKFL